MAADSQNLPQNDEEKYELITSDRYDSFVHLLENEFDQATRRIDEVVVHHPASARSTTTLIQGEIDFIADRLDIVKSVLIARDDVNRYASLLNRAKSTLLQQLVDSLQALKIIDTKWIGTNRLLEKR